MVRVDVLSGEALDMDRSDWPASWAELVSSVEAGVSFRVGLCLRAGMDAAARTAELDSLRFPADLNWDVLDQGYALLRSQQPFRRTILLTVRKKWS